MPHGAMDAPGTTQAGELEPWTCSQSYLQETNNSQAHIPASQGNSPEVEAEKRKVRRNVMLVNVGLTSFFLVYLASAMTLGLFVILPEVVIPELELPAQLAAWYISIMTLANHYGTWYFANKSHFSPLKLDRLPTQNPTTGGWWYCKSCDMNCPPRARHCMMCRVCVLKRDHHCFFAFNCVGYHNQRFFVVMCLYCFLGALYCTVVTGLYLGPRYAYFISGDWYTYLVPVLLYRLAIGEATVAVVGFYIYFCISLFICLGASYFMIWQSVLIVRGQTPIEMKKKVHTYRQSILENFHQVFGPAGPLNLIFPLLFLDIPGDGISWNLASSRVKAS